MVRMLVFQEQHPTFEFTQVTHVLIVFSLEVIVFHFKLGSVAGPVIQANGRLSFEDDLRSGSLQ